MEIAAVSAVVRGADGRGCHVFDAAVRRERLCGRNACRDGSGPCCAVFGVCGALPAADRPIAFDNASEPLDAYGGRGPARVPYVSTGCFDRQRESSQRTDHGSSGHLDRPHRRSTFVARAVHEAFRQRRSVRRATAISHALRIRKRAGRLYLRAVAGADRKGAGDRAGMPFTV